MRTDRSVLILGVHSANMGSLADRVRDLGYPTVRVKTPQEAIDLSRERNLEYGVGFFEPEGLAFNLCEALDAIRCCSNSPELIFVATGAEPGEQDRTVLRQAGVEHALWAPVEDHTLRFQLNAALSPPHEEYLRCDARAPIDAPATVRTGGRVKQVSIFSISTGGAFLETPRPSLSGAQLELTLATPDGELAVAARVLYTNTPGNLSQPKLPMGMAVHFEGLGRSASDAIRELVQCNSAALTV